MAEIAGILSEDVAAVGFVVLGATGFLTWLAFLVTTGLRLVRSEAVRG